MEKKRLTKYLWYGSDVDPEGKPIVPEVSADDDHLSGINEGEVYIHNHPDKPAIYIRTTDGKVVPIGADNLEDLEKIFLRKDKDDRSRGLIASDKGFEVGKFQKGVLGAGAAMYQNAEKATFVETDFLTVRKKAFFTNITVQELKRVGGVIILSPAAMVCSKVEETTTGWKCYFNTKDADGRRLYNEFEVGDQARCQTFNLEQHADGMMGNRYYWRLIKEVGEDFIVLSKTDHDKSVPNDIPQEGDNICQLGNRDDSLRQNAIVISAYGTDAPSFKQYKGIKTYNMADAELVTVFSYSENFIKGKFVSEATGKDLEEEVNKVRVDWENVLNQTDKEFTMWFFAHDPSPTEMPEVEWTSSELKALHEEDLFYNTETGKAWRYKSSYGLYFWDVITDADTIKALENAAKAQETADKATQRLDNIVADNILSAAEKKEVRKEWMSIVDAYEWNMYSSEKIGVDMSASEVVEYSDAYAELREYITPLLANSEDSPIYADEYRGYWTAYYTAETKLRNFLSEKAKEKADKVEEKVEEISSDGILSALEKKEVRKEWMSIVEEYHSNVATAENFGMTAEDSALDGYIKAYNSLGSYMNGGGWDGISIPAWLSDLASNQEIDGNVYRSHWTAYYDAERNLLNRISIVAKEKAEDAREEADKANEELGEIASDNILSKVEKKEALREWTEAFDSYQANIDNAKKYKVSTSAYQSAFVGLSEYLNGGADWDGSSVPLWLADLTANQEIDGDVFRQKWTDYYSAEVALLDTISSAIKSLADKAQDTADEKIRNFVAQPVPPYDRGDRWSNANYTLNGAVLAENDDMVCIKPKAHGEEFDFSDWQFVSLMNSGTDKLYKAQIKNLGDRIDLNVESIDALNKTATQLGVRLDGVAEEVALYAEKVSENEASIAELKVKTDSIQQSVTSTQGGVDEAKALASSAKTLAVTASMTGMYSGEEYNQTENPWNEWVGGEEHKHVGAIWYNPNTKVTKRYIGTDNSNSWELVDNSLYASATFVYQNKNKWSAIAAKFDADGNPVASSGIVTTSDYAALFSEQWSENETVRAEIGTFVTKNADGTLSSNVKISADNVDINGFAKVGTNAMSIGGFTINTDYMQAGVSTATGIMTLSATTLGFKEDGGMHVLIGPGAFGSAGEVGLYSNATSGGFSVWGIGGAKMVARETNSEMVLIGGLALTYKFGNSFVYPSNSPSGTTGAWADFLVMTGNTSLPNPSSCPGKVVFVKCQSGYTLTVPSGKDSEGNSKTSWNDGRARFFISSSDTWYEFYCS